MFVEKWQKKTSGDFKHCFIKDNVYNFVQKKLLIIKAYVAMKIVQHVDKNKINKNVLNVTNHLFYLKALAVAENIQTLFIKENAYKIVRNIQSLNNKFAVI